MPVFVFLQNQSYTEYRRGPTALRAAGAAQGARTEPRQDGAVGTPQVRAQEVRGRAGRRARASARTRRAHGNGSREPSQAHGSVLGWAHNLMFRYTGWWLVLSN